MKNFALIVAGGSGTRLNHTIPKQFMLVGNSPILMNTISVFHRTNIFDEIIVVLPSSQTTMWSKLCQQYNFQVPITIVNGGETRFQSVQNGLSALQQKKGIVAIHDGIRMFISPKFIKFCVNEAITHTNAVPCCHINESLRVQNNNQFEILDRNLVRSIQTPQCFLLEEIQNAYSHSCSQNFTDDASVLESSGKKINLIKGLRNNIKITYPEDIQYANYLISTNND